MKSLLTVVLFLGALDFTLAAGAACEVNDAERAKRLEWWTEARFGLFEGKSVADAIAFAQKAAAISVMRPGAQTSVPWRREVRT